MSGLRYGGLAGLGLLTFARAAAADLPPLPPPQGQPSPYAQPPPPAQGPYAPAPTPGPYAPTPAPPPPRPEEEEKPGWELDYEVWGLRGTSLGVVGGDRETRTLGLGFGSVGLANGQRRVFTYRGEHLAHIGGGGGGFEGALSGSLTLGFGWLAEGEHGPFLRGGIQGQLQGNDSFYQSMLRFPRGEIGWHIGTKKGFVLELGGTAAPMLNGRFNVGDVATRRLGSSSGYGAYADLMFGPLFGTLEWIHTNARSVPGTPVDDVAGHVCLGPGPAKEKKWAFGLCFDGRHTTGDVGIGEPSRNVSAGATYLGITIGIGTSVTK